MILLRSRLLRSNLVQGNQKLFVILDYLFPVFFVQTLFVWSPGRIAQRATVRMAAMILFSFIEAALRRVPSNRISGP